MVRHTPGLTHPTHKAYSEKLVDSAAPVGSDTGRADLDAMTGAADTESWQDSFGPSFEGEFVAHRNVRLATCPSLPDPTFHEVSDGLMTIAVLDRDPISGRLTIEGGHPTLPTAHVLHAGELVILVSHEDLEEVVTVLDDREENYESGLPICSYGKTLRVSVVDLLRAMPAYLGAGQDRMTQAAADKLQSIAAERFGLEKLAFDAAVAVPEYSAAELPGSTGARVGRWLHRLMDQSPLGDDQRLAGRVSVEVKRDQACLVASDDKPEGSGNLYIETMAVEDAAAWKKLTDNERQEKRDTWPLRPAGLSCSKAAIYLEQLGAFSVLLDAKWLHDQARVRNTIMGGYKKQTRGFLLPLETVLELAQRDPITELDPSLWDGMDAVDAHAEGEGFADANRTERERIFYQWLTDRQTQQEAPYDDEHDYSDEVAELAAAGLL